MEEYTVGLGANNNSKYSSLTRTVDGDTGWAVLHKYRLGWWSSCVLPGQVPAEDQLKKLLMTVNTGLNCYR